eukprot:CAMPEP_0178977952 /NCGR_PEP_ID=MMETSP0789-20121207/24833_1 /TAXON_ID=3005 /ORGANISM="Rhizosolenia setigera, Strain CCMP 1694" /LENGTH=702 /DNA_ID=CAMNT_0020667525 /DNA_START=375 /DNA_END=2482 /DNA_ORIENTATION=-
MEHSHLPSAIASDSPSVSLSNDPTPFPTRNPSLNPIKSPTVSPVSGEPTKNPTLKPSFKPTFLPTKITTISPSLGSTTSSTPHPTAPRFPGPSPDNITSGPSSSTNKIVSGEPTKYSTPNPSFKPTFLPTQIPSEIQSFPSSTPSEFQSLNPSTFPSMIPTISPTLLPTKNKTTLEPTLPPTSNYLTRATVYIYLRDTVEMDDGTKATFEATTENFLASISLDSEDVSITIISAEVQWQIVTSSRLSSEVEITSEQDFLKTAKGDENLINSGLWTGTLKYVVSQTIRNGGNRLLEENESSPYLLVQLVVEGEVFSDDSKARSDLFEDAILKGMTENIDIYASELVSASSNFNGLDTNYFPSEDELLEPLVVTAIVAGALIGSLIMMGIGLFTLHGRRRRRRDSNRRNGIPINQVRPSFSTWTSFSFRRNQPNVQNNVDVVQDIDYAEPVVRRMFPYPNLIDVFRQDSFSTLSFHGNRDAFSFYRGDKVSGSNSKSEPSSLTKSSPYPRDPRTFTTPKTSSRKQIEATSLSIKNKPLDEDAVLVINTSMDEEITPKTSSRKKIEAPSLPIEKKPLDEGPVIVIDTGKVEETDLLMGSSSSFQDLDGRQFYEVSAPPGLLGLVIDSSLEGPCVYNVKEDSPLLGLVEEDDVIVSIDGIDTREMSATVFTEYLLAKKDEPERLITILGNRVEDIITNANDDQVTM